MNILVLLRMVPDVVEELEVAPDGKALDLDAARMILSESDGHALEQAILLKERHGGTVTAVALDAPEVDDALFSALAQGADRALKITGAEPGLTTCGAAKLFADVVTSTAGLMPAELVVTGVQATDDLDGLIAPLVALRLGWPMLDIVTRVEVDASARAAAVIREYSGGLRGEFELPLPAVLGIQAAEKPPRYVPVAKVRAAMKSQKIDTVDAPPAPGPLAEVIAMAKPEAAAHAEMLEGSPEDVAAKVCDLLAERGLL